MKDPARIFSVLSDNCRLEILRHLAKKRGCVSEIRLATGRSQPNVSQHLRVLRDSGLVKTHREGKKVCYELSGGKVRKLLSLAGKLGGN